MYPQIAARRLSLGAVKFRFDGYVRDRFTRLLPGKFKQGRVLTGAAPR